MKIFYDPSNICQICRQIYISIVGRLGKSCFIALFGSIEAMFPFPPIWFEEPLHSHFEVIYTFCVERESLYMENKTANLIEWTVQDVGREIKKKFNEDIAKKFEGEILRPHIGQWNFD